jgi:prepilin-type N-terminal cleavage/methylation domain-containing protein
MRSHKGFTLIELSIVLIIIGLLVAGVLLGRSLVENAALQSVASEFEGYRTAALNYRSKYMELPGDHTSATGLTSADGGCSTPAASDAMTTATCNGNGDGIVGDGNGNPMAAISNYSEPLLVWQHLTNAGMLSGQYNGRRTTSSNLVTVGINTPISKVAGASFVLRYFPTNTVTTGFYKTTYNHVMFFGQPDTSSNGYRLPFSGAALTTEQAKSIDQKFDDGMPGLGKVLTLPYSVRPCATNGTEITSVYDGSITAPACSLIFITGF